MSHVVAVMALCRVQSKPKEQQIENGGGISCERAAWSRDDGGVLLHGHAVTWHCPRCKEKLVCLWKGEEKEKIVIVQNRSINYAGLNFAHQSAHQKKNNIKQVYSLMSPEWENSGDTWNDRNAREEQNNAKMKRRRSLLICTFISLNLKLQLA